MSNAVLIDITSIQQYVFGSNSLKENIGASTIVGHVLSESFITEEFKIPKEKIGYSGGGSALLFFDDENKAKTFVREYSLKLLAEFPALIPSFAVGEIDFGKGFKESKNKLFKELAENKSDFAPQVTPSSHGFTAECSKSGYSMNVWDPTNNEYISSVIKKKIIFSDTGNSNAQEYIPEEERNKYSFTENFGNLGGTENVSSHIAVVFADGNSMGERFGEIEALEEIKKFSAFLKTATETAFGNMIKRIIKEFDVIRKEISISIDTDGKAILPIRPVFIGGDDIVFVCDGRLGLYFAKTFLEEFAKQSNTKYKISASAGVAITGAKFPFFKAHHLAEELCKNAKKERLNDKDGGSWIDYQILYGGFSGSLRDLREKQFKPNGNNLLMRPYKIGDIKNIYGFERLLENTTELYKKDDSGKQIIPNSKIKELREVLTKDKGSFKLFLSEIGARNIKLPEIVEHDFSNQLFIDGITPYFDMIELNEFYPEILRKNQKGGNNG